MLCLLGKYWRMSPLVFFVGPAFPRTMGRGEVEPGAGRGSADRSHQFVAPHEFDGLLVGSNRAPRALGRGHIHRFLVLVFFVLSGRKN